MHQVDIFPAGPQMWFRFICATSSSRFAFASSLAVYVYSRSTRRVERVLTVGEKNITCMCWSPTNENLIACCASDRRLRVWNVLQGAEVFNGDMGPDDARCIAWSPHDRNLLAYCTTDGNARFVDIGEGMSYALSIGGSLTVCAWNPCRSGQFAVGTTSGKTYFLKMQGTKILQKLEYDPDEDSEDTGPVADLNFDPLGSNSTYLLVAHQSSGSITLLNCEDMQPVPGTKFDRAPGGISSINWVPGVPGGFVTTGANNGLLRLWNVSDNRPALQKKTHDGAFTLLKFFPESTEAFCVYKDGRCGVYDYKQGSWFWKSPGGHTETVFDCKFDPCCPDRIVTAGFDGTLKIWNILSHKCERDFSVIKGSALYSVDWSPTGEGLIASGTASGHCSLVKAAGGPVATFPLHDGKKVYRVCFCPLQPTKLASAGENKMCVVWNTTGAVLHKLPHPDVVSGCDWSKFNSDILATACDDGNIRIFDLADGSSKASVLLKQHSMRAFSVSFSPFFPEILASTSDDTTVCVWNYKTHQCLHQLQGHTQKARQVRWHNALPHMLFSSSWDASIRLWNTQTGKCERVNHDHGADVYGLDSHPQRPFLIMSSSRDMSTRLWSLEFLVRDLQMAMLVNGSKSVFGNPTNWHPESPVSGERLQLCGPGGQTLSKALDAVQNENDRCALIMRYFAAPKGSSELLAILQGITGQGTLSPCLASSDVFLAAHSTQVVESEISELQNQKAMGSKRREERLREIANMQLQLGRVKQYCECMIELNEWEHALAFAPAVSQDYWRSLSLQYAERLVAEGSSDKAASHWIAAGQVDLAIRSAMGVGLQKRAFVLATMQAEGSMPPGAQGAPGEQEQRPQPLGEHSAEVIKVTKARVRSYRHSAHPVLAACSLLAVDQSDQALQTLVTANELAQALVLCKVMQKKPTRELYSSMGRTCANLGNFAEALKWAQMAGSERLVDQLCLQVLKDNPAGAEAFLTSASRRTQAAFLEDAAGCVADGNTAEAVRCYMLGGDPTAACNLALETLHAVMAADSWDMQQVNAIIRNLGICSIKEVAPEIAGQVLCYAALVGLFQAFWRDQRMIWHGLVLTVDQKAHTLPGVQKEKVQSYVQHFRKILSGLTGLGNTLYATGQLLPSALHKPGSESLASGMVLSGPVIVLDNGGFITRSEALMWAQVCPFSPSKTGDILDPFQM